MDKTEDILIALFDFQRFEGNVHLDKIIGLDRKNAFGIPLNDSELEVNAAGEFDTWRTRTEENKKL